MSNDKPYIVKDFASKMPNLMEQQMGTDWKKAKKRQGNASKRGRNNKNRGKVWERNIAEVFGGKRNISDSTPHTDVETDTEVFEIKSRQSKMPALFDGAFKQLALASEESNKEQGGVVVVYTGGPGGKARAVLIKEIELK